MKPFFEARQFYLKCLCPFFQCLHFVKRTQNCRLWRLCMVYVWNPILDFVRWCLLNLLIYNCFYYSGNLFACLFRLIPESPRWLISKGRYKEARAVLRRMEKVNHVILPENAIGSDSVETPPSQSVLKVFTIPKLLIRTLVIYFNWQVLVVYTLHSVINSRQFLIYCQIFLKTEVQSFILHVTFPCLMLHYVSHRWFDFFIHPGVNMVKTFMPYTCVYSYNFFHSSTSFLFKVCGQHGLLWVKPQRRKPGRRYLRKLRHQQRRWSRSVHHVSVNT